LTDHQPDDQTTIVASDLYEARDTSRLEAFSDGVFGVSITLLVLGIKTPPANDAFLVRDLLIQWPEYAAYVFSFIMIGIYWMNHHHIFKYIRNTDQYLMFFNVLLLMWIGIIPFATDLLAENIAGQPSLERISAIVFGGIWLTTGLFYNLLWRYAVSRPELLEPDVDPGVLKSLTRDYDFGNGANAVVLALAFVSVPLSLILLLFVTMFFARPASKRGPTRRRERINMSSR
jgi:uncharacterized membrane protein